jgi:hypothetical protein
MTRFGWEYDMDSLNDVEGSTHFFTLVVGGERVKCYEHFYKPESIRKSFE